MTYIVIENTPGYMPDSDDPFVTDDYSAAVAYANELADQLEDDGYDCDRSWASSGNYYAIHCTRSDTVAPDLGRTIAVELAE
jgi:hypothetical protein